MSILASAVGRLRTQMLHIAVFSCVINLLGLVGSIYMLQVYDRVLSSRSETTLLFLTLIVGMLFLGQSLLEWSRQLVAGAAGRRFEEPVAPRLFDAAFEATRRGRTDAPVHYFRDLTQVRDFVTGPAFQAFCDLPWFPIYLAVAFLLHHDVGLLSLGGAIVIFALTVLNEVVTRRASGQANKTLGSELNFISSTFRNAEAIRAMGMRPTMKARWARLHADGQAWALATARRGGVVLAATRFVRLFLQSLVLGLGAYLVIHGELSGGSMIACSILMSRALAPIEQVVAQWKSFLAAREAMGRLGKLFAAATEEPDRITLPTPAGNLAAQSLHVGPPGAAQAFLRGISFSLDRGQVLAVIGPSASGKSTLARAIVGAWPLMGGKLRLDGADFAQWDPDRLGRHIGYLPQDVELFAGTVAENIARFTERNDAMVLKAAMLAGVHDLILRLPNGYDTEIGERGEVLSGGTRQRIGLARAVYGDPCLVVLDEPNANLDNAGDTALAEAVASLKKAGTTVVMITHRTGLVHGADQVMMLEAGQIRHYGAREEVLAALRAPAKSIQKPQVEIVRSGT
jgi:PrtD family type I secretion system ABC transporter